MSSDKDIRSVAQRVFDTPELKEMILLQRDPRDLLAHLHHDADSITMVKSSPALQYKLYFRQKPEVSVVVPDYAFAHHAAVGDPNRILMPSDDVEYKFRFHEGGHQYRIQAKQDHRRDDWPEGIKPQFYEYTLCASEQRYHGEFTSPIFSPAYLSTDLTGHAIPIRVYTYTRTNPASWKANSTNTDPAKPQCKYYGGPTWVPPGKTLGDILHWIERRANGKTKGSDVVDGMCEFKLLGVIGEPDGAMLEWETKKRLDGIWVLRRDGVWMPPLKRTMAQL